MKKKVEYKGKNVVGAFINLPIFVEYFSTVIDFTVVEDMDAYRDKDMGDVIVGKPFCREANIDARRFEGMITLHNGNDSVTYMMPRAEPRFKHVSNKVCNKMWPILVVDKKDEQKGIKYSYRKIKGFYKGMLNLGLEYVQDEKMVEWLTRGHVSIHEME